MKQAILTFFAFMISALGFHAQEDPRLEAVKSADEARITAMMTADRAGLVAVFSDELRYAHSTGQQDTKASFIEILTSGKTDYLSMEYPNREFSFPAPDIALMIGRAHIRAATADKNYDDVLSFLAVWRLEKGQWRFLAWQSCKLPPAVKP